MKKLYTLYRWILNPRTLTYVSYESSKRKFFKQWENDPNIWTIPCTPENLKLTQFYIEINGVPMDFITKRDNLLLWGKL